MSITLDNKINFWTNELSIIVDVEIFNAAEFARWLREKRENARPYLSVTALAAKAGISKQYVSLLEKGGEHLLTSKPVQPSLEKVERLAKALDVNIEEARQKAGYLPAPSKDEDDWDSAVRIAFLGAENWDDDEKAEVLKAVKRFVAGFRAERAAKLVETEENGKSMQR